MHRKTRFETISAGQAGTSLIEALVAISIFAVLALAAIAVFFSLTKTQTKTTISGETYTQAQTILKEITMDARQARMIKDDYTEASQLALQMNDNSIIIYDWEAESLYRKRGLPTDPNPLRLNSDQVRITSFSVEVTKGGIGKPDAVTVSLSAESVDNDGTKPQLRAAVDLQTTVVLRSY
ncbi:MAG TPA: prepilin-type N-terminal cleavage/methylation domain-containing protein [bacterium]|nr:prepilin-type N-terminal cleavage/methylation domain-containing protein [bacterium]